MTLKTLKKKIKKHFFKNTIDSLKWRLNQLKGKKIKPRKPSLGMAASYNQISRKDYADMLKNRKKCAMIAELIHMLETSDMGMQPAYEMSYAA